MSNRAAHLARRAVRDALRALRDAFVEPDRRPPARSRFVRAATWLWLPVALVTLLVSFDVSRSEVTRAPEPTPLSVDVLLVLASLASAVAVAGLGRRALVAWRIAAVTCTVWLLLGPPTYDGDFVWGAVQTWVLVASTVLVATRYERSVTWGTWGWTALLLVLGGYGPAAGGLLLAVTVVVVVVDARRQRTRAKAEAAREREARVRQEAHAFLLEERTRIARDLHDVVAHHMSMVAVQSETARYRLADLDPATRDEFASIAESARAALTDVRGILTVLRDESGAAARAPQPTLAGLEDLVDGARGAGTDVALVVEGERRPLGTAVEIAAYRIVQEALANATRHAPGAAVTVALAYGERELAVVVTNGRPAGPPSAGAEGGGHGLVGMRERAVLLGGGLTAGPDADGGFRVAATLPVQEGET